MDSLHAQNMESHKDVLAQVGVDVDDIKAPDLCLVGEYLGPTGESMLKESQKINAV